MIYDSVNMDEIKKQAEQLKAVDSQKGDYAKNTDIVNKPWDVGDNFIWLLPPLKGRDFLKYSGTHFELVQPNGDRLIRDCARNTTSHGRCPIDDVLLAASAFTDISSMAESSSYNGNVVKLTLGDDGILYPERQRPYVYKFPKSARQAIIMLMSNQKIMDVTDPFSGFILKVTRPKEISSYAVKVCAQDGSDLGIERCMMPTPAELNGDLEAQQRWIEECLKQIHDLDKIFKEPVGKKFESILEAAQGLLKSFQSRGISIDSSILDEYVHGDFWKDASIKDEEPVKVDTPVAVETPKVEVPKTEAPVDASIFDDRTGEKNIPVKGTKPLMPEDMVTIGSKDFVIIGLTGTTFILENEEGETRYACQICMDKTWGREVYAEKHEASHKVTSTPTVEPTVEPVTEVVPTSDLKVKAKAEDKVEAGDSRSYVNSAGKQVKSDMECFGNFGNDDKCHPRLRNVCPDKHICEEKTKEN